jgi:hypothetical protein
VGEVAAPKDEGERRVWVEQRLHGLRHGQEQAVLREIAALPLRRGKAGKVLRRKQSYFASQAQRMNYQVLAERGRSIGSGAVEWACRQRQCRRKRPGQFWTARGLRQLEALEEARDNGHWDELWTMA